MSAKPQRPGWRAEALTKHVAVVRGDDGKYSTRPNWRKREVRP